MKRIIAAAFALAGLCSCGGGKDKIADRVEQAADNRADTMEAASRSMSNALQRDGVRAQAKLTRDAGKERADAIRSSQLKPDRLTDAQKNALVNAH